MSIVAFEEPNPRRELSWRALTAATRRLAAAVRDAPGQQFALRALIAVLALAAVAAAVSFDDLRMIPAGILGLIGASMAAAAPRSYGSAVVLAAAVIAWLTRYGVNDPAPLGRTILVAALLYLTLTTTTLAASMPITARFDRSVIIAWHTHSAIALVLFGVVAAIVYAISDLPASFPLELAGLAAVIVPIAVLTWLARHTPEE